MIGVMKLALILAATVALAACEDADQQTVEARARAQRDGPSYLTPVYPQTTNCLASSALTYSCPTY
jgi:hypothetical protein